MDMNIVIAPARPEDAEEMLTLSQIIGGEADNLSFGNEGIRLSVEKEREVITTAGIAPRDLLLVARADDVIVGYARYSSFFTDAYVPSRRDRHLHTQVSLGLGDRQHDHCEAAFLRPRPGQGGDRLT